METTNTATAGKRGPLPRLLVLVLGLLVVLAPLAAWAQCDVDSDGWDSDVWPCEGQDCDDGDDQVYPGAPGG